MNRGGKYAILSSAWTCTKNSINRPNMHEKSEDSRKKIRIVFYLVWIQGKSKIISLNRKIFSNFSEHSSIKYIRTCCSQRNSLHSAILFVLYERNYNSDSLWVSLFIKPFSSVDDESCVSHDSGVTILCTHEWILQIFQIRTENCNQPLKCINTRNDFADQNEFYLKVEKETFVFILWSKMCGKRNSFESERNKYNLSA